MLDERQEGLRKKEISGPAAFDELYETYCGAVYSFALYLSKNRPEAEDLFQETWLKVVRNMDDINYAKDVKAWIFTITANLYRDALRKKRVRAWLVFPKAKDTQRGGQLDRYPSMERNANPATGAAARDLLKKISAALDRLPERQRMVFVLREIEGFKYAEIGDICKMPLGTVKSLLNRAVRRLRKELAAWKPAG
jgi:RNA polymerase sigma-70 factor (ECF subfamily)